MSSTSNPSDANGTPPAALDYVPIAKGWFGTPPDTLGRGVQDQFAVALWRLRGVGRLEVEERLPEETHLVCAHLVGRMDMAAAISERRYTRPCLPGTATYGRPGERASLVFGNPRIEFIHFYIPDRWLKARVDEIAPRSRAGEFEVIDPMNARCEAISRASRLAARAIASAEPASRLEVEAAGMLLAAALVRHHSNAMHSPARPAGGLAPHVLVRVTDYMTNHLADDISIADLAAVARLSPFHFLRCFKASTGEPPHQFLTRLRIEKAKELLEHTSASITTIAADVGYDDPSSLARMFRQSVGVSPARYRRDRKR
jgi:AraC family transcriptional regulator